MPTKDKDIEEEEGDFTFRGQRADETVIIAVHQHAWALAQLGLWIGLGLAVIILAFYWFKLSAPSIWTFFIIGGVGAVYVAYRWFIWWNNMYILTNQRLILIFQKSLWRRRIEDYGLEKIQSVASETPGPVGAMLNLGNVLIAVMGIKDQVVLPFVEDPRNVQDLTLTAMRESGVKVHQYDKRGGN